MKRFTIVFSLCLLGAITLQAKEDREYTPFDRGIDAPNSLFIPKGTFGGGLTVSFNSFDIGSAESGYTLLSPVLTGINGSFNTFSIAPQVSWFFADNLSAGLRFDYSKTGLNLGNADLSLNEDLGISLADISYQRQSYKGALTLRNYMPIQHSRRFALFVEARLSGAYAQSKNVRLDEGLRHGTYQDIYKAALDLVPGICVFVMNSVSFEVQVGVMGISWQKIVQTENQVKRSEIKRNGGNFNINLLSIGFGVNFFLMDKWHRPVKK